MAVQRAECWNTHGAFGVAAEDLIPHLAALNQDVTARCAAAGRDPATLRRSVLLLGPLWPWSQKGRLVEVVELMSRIGYEEIVVFWPWTSQDRVVFEADAPTAF